MNDDEDLSRRIRDSMRQAPDPSTPDLGAVTRRARTLRVRRVIVGLASALIVVAAVAVPLILLSPLGSRSRVPVGATPSRSEVGTLALSRITAPPAGRNYPVYFEGAIAFLRIQTDQGEIVLDKQSENWLSSLSIDVQLKPGGYLLESYVRVCDANCGFLDPPIDKCSAEFQMRSGERLAAIIRYQPEHGCAIMWTTQSPQGATPGASELPDVAEVVCDDTGTHVLTPEVKPQSDGVHFRIDNQTGKRLQFTIHGSGGDGASPGVTELVSLVPPGSVSVVCWDLLGGQPPGTYAPLTILDEDGIYVSATPECLGAGDVTGFFDYVSGAKGQVGDPVELARDRFQGLQEGDLVQLVGYPAQAGTIVGVIRDGRTIATATYNDDGQGGWLVSEVSRCEDSGLMG